jgi:beta-carotene ketolase (CrtO type)
MAAMAAAPRLDPSTDADAIVVGAGHNGLITAAYLAKAGLRTILLEARASVGGTAASESFAGGTVNICNCDHLTFRTTPVMDELDLAGFGLTYLDVDPSQHNIAWSGGAAWTHHHSLDDTVDSLRASLPDEVEAYQRYIKAARPMVELILAAAVDPPSFTGLTGHALRRRFAGVPTMLRWSRRSAADVLRSFFRHDSLLGTASVVGPMVWGISPETPGTGLGALSHAMRHVGRVGRPVGGSGMVPTSILAAFEHHGGTLRTKSPVDTILCDRTGTGDGGIRGVSLVDGTELTAPIVVSACNPHSTFLEWLKNPPPAAVDLVRRWRAIPHHQGYESKIDAIVDTVPRLRALDVPPGATTVIAPSLAEIHRGHAMMAEGEVLERPGMLVNVPTVLDPSMAPEQGASGLHVFSLEALYTPYALRGGWPGSAEPWRWLERFADLCEPGFLDSIVEWRAMTPDIYESDFHLPAGHATSFAGGPLAAFRNANPELTRYETSVRGLYLTGAATFPGAGVWGASGRNCATVVLGHLGAA